MENQEVGLSTSPLAPLEGWQQEFFRHLEESGRSLNTLKNYRTDIDCFNRYLLERQNSLDMLDFNSQKVLEYGEYICQKYGSNNSRRRRVQALRIFFDFLVQKKLYRENPVRKLPTEPKFLDIPGPRLCQMCKKCGAT